VEKPRSSHRELPLRLASRVAEQTSFTMLTDEQLRRVQQSAARMEVEAVLMHFRAAEMRKVALEHYERGLMVRERLAVRTARH
jgi:hypothetical protein